MGQELKPHPLNLARPIAIPKWRMVFLNISIYPGLHSLKMTVQGWHCSNPISQLQYFFQAWSHNIIFQNFGKLNIKPTSYVYIFSGMRISIWHTLFVSKKNYRLHPLALIFFFFFFHFRPLTFVVDIAYRAVKQCSFAIGNFEFCLNSDMLGKVFSPHLSYKMQIKKTFDSLLLWQSHSFP